MINVYKILANKNNCTISSGGDITVYGSQNNYMYFLFVIHKTVLYTGAGHIIRISSKSWFH